ncbi:bacteriocin immunity protein [Enterococcus faecalis]|uniref:bacteriocin immunity protein n=1 Tax=Enterococcus faecalis TaxID=1351 RepID=UPI002455609A|nr:bacteriocin immunity protein [Enterococcus faecalis]MDH5039552.1 bacteriocin immunity protein [Enterococcus faecalis]
MVSLKWYSGGDEREKKAEKIIIDLLNDLENDLGNESLQQVLNSYLEELRKGGASVPLILSRMNLDISKAIRNDGRELTASQSSKLKELTSISNIRYGY